MKAVKDQKPMTVGELIRKHYPTIRNIVECDEFQKAYLNQIALIKSQFDKRGQPPTGKRWKTSWFETYLETKPNHITIIGDIWSAQSKLSANTRSELRTIADQVLVRVCLEKEKQEK